jgi:hypothetical protein
MFRSMPGGSFTMLQAMIIPREGPGLSGGLRPACLDSDSFQRLLTSLQVCNSKPLGSSPFDC